MCSIQLRFYALPASTLHNSTPGTFSTMYAPAKLFPTVPGTIGKIEIYAKMFFLRLYRHKRGRANEEREMPHDSCTMENLKSVMLKYEFASQVYFSE